MTDSNRLQLAAVAETTLGTTPTTPRMRLMRLTGESLSYKPAFVSSQEIRSDRMKPDPIKVGEDNGGGINFEMHYPVPLSPLAEALASAFMAAWTQTPERDNDGTADSVITDIATTNTVATVTTGAGFVVGHLVKFSGFTVANNNGVFRCTTASATVPRFVGSGITDEAAPAAAARMKVVGFAGASADITATSTGLGSTLLDFTTLGLAVGMWVKIGGTATADKFATAALNSWARITVIAATALTLDNRPTGWTTDAGTGKTIKVWFGDRIVNGTSKRGMTFERGFLGQTTPTYVVQTGMVANTFELRFQKKERMLGSFEFLGMAGSQSTTALDASPDAAPSNSSYPILACAGDVGRISEAGAAVVTPNFISSLTCRLGNNLRVLEAVGSAAPVGIGTGSSDVMVTMETYFGDNALLTKLLAGTATSASAIATKNSQSIVMAFPRLTAKEGSPNAGGANQDVMLSLQMEASYDSTTAAQVTMDRLEYVE